MCIGGKVLYGFYSQDKNSDFTPMICPCCGSLSTTPSCKVCSHKWQRIGFETVDADYADKSGRNSMPEQFNSRKIRERLEALKPLISPGMRILDIGCAEGELGRELKKIKEIHITGIEPSKDAKTARKHLDRIYDDCSDIPSDERRYDLIISFHVLEHITNILNELRTWRNLISSRGQVIIEVPCETGHQLVFEDKNKEHLHSFNFTSLSNVLAKSGFDVMQMSRNHFESPVYNDSLRVLAHPSLSKDEKFEILLESFSRLPKDIYIYAIGGDFESYVLPVLDKLNVGGLLDKNPKRIHCGENLIPVEKYRFADHGNHQILISSIRFQQEILSDLISYGHPLENIFFLSDIYNNE